MGEYIVDARIGCVAAYREPRRQCLDGIADDPDCIFYAPGVWMPDAYRGNGGWTIDPEDIRKAREAVEAMHWMIGEGDE